LLQKSRDVLATQSFFSRRWLKNSVKFCVYLRRPCTIEAGNQPTGLDVSPDGKKIVLSDFLDNRIRVYELKSSLLE